MNKQPYTKRELFPPRFKNAQDAMAFMAKPNIDIAIPPMKQIGEVYVTNPAWRDAPFELTYTFWK